MSKGARVTIAVAILLGGICFVLSGLAFGHEAPAGPLGFYGLAAFCFLVATACLSRRSRPVALPIIAVVVVAALWAANRERLLTALAIPGAVVGGILLAGVAVYLYVRWRDRVWLRAVRLARAGDGEGAVALLREHLRRAGPSARTYHHLALLLLVGQEWEEALHMAEEAERLGGPQPGVLGSKGLALWKLGRCQEALACLYEATRGQPQDLIAACNYGTLLAELGHADEAAEMLGRAEQLFATQYVLGGAADRRAREQALEELRRRASEAAPGAGEKWHGRPWPRGGGEEYRRPRKYGRGRTTERRAGRMGRDASPPAAWAWVNLLARARRAG